MRLSEVFKARMQKLRFLTGRLTTVFMCLMWVASAQAQEIVYNGIVYNILTEAESDASGTCEVGNNQSYAEESVKIPLKVYANNLGYVVTNISDSAFYNNKSIKSLDFEFTNITNVGAHAFENCVNLSTIKFTQLLESIQEFAFAGCVSWRQSAMPFLKYIGPSAFAGSGMITIGVTSGYLETAYLNDCPELDGVTLDYNRNLTTVTFAGDSKLSYINMEFCGLEELTEEMFTDCSNLSGIHLPDVKSIGENFFSFTTNLLYLTLPSTLETIGSNAFSTSDLEYIENRAHSAVEMEGENIFSEETYENCELYVLPHLIDDYRSTYPWSNFKNIKSMTVIDSIFVEPSIVIIEPGEMVELEAWWEPLWDAYVENFVWTIEDDEIATIEFSGNYLRLYAKKEGKTTVRIANIYDTSVYKDVPVVVTSNLILAEGISIEPAKISSPLNGPAQTLKAVFTPKNASVDIASWSSSDPLVATVNDAGTLTFTGIGTCEITATTVDGTDMSTSCLVTVTDPVATSFKVDPESITLNIDDSYDLSIKLENESEVLPEEITWSTSDALIAEVDENGTVTAINPGEATVTATADVFGETVSASCVVTVVRPMASSMTVNPSSVTIGAGSSEVLTAEVSPVTALPSVEWSTDNESVIELVESDNALSVTITGLQPGEATITVKTTDGTNLTATCTVEVVAVATSGISLNVKDMTIDIADGRVPIGVTIEPGYATAPELIWESSDESVATVESIGSLKAEIVPLLAGVAVITVSSADDPTQFDTCTVTVIGVASLGDVFDDMSGSGPVEVYDMNGRLIMKAQTSDDVENLRPGIYIFRQGENAKKVLIQ